MGIRAAGPLGRGGRALAFVGALIALAVMVLVAAPARAAAAQTVVSIEFDDGVDNQFQTLAMLQAHEMRGTYYINSSSVGDPGKMSWTQLDALAAAGNEIGGHTLTHPHLTQLSTADQTNEICADRQNLLAHGFQVTDFAYPFGDFNEGVMDVVRGCGYSSGRAASGIVSPTGCNGCSYAEDIPPLNTYALRTPQNVLTTMTLADIEHLVTQAEDHGGGWVQLVFHHVCATGCDSYAVTPGDFAALLDWLQPRAAQGTVMRTVAQVMAMPSPPPPPAERNLLRNPSLEADANADQVPDCWQLGGFGNNTFSWARVTDAHSSGFAEKSTITAYTDGDRKLVSRQDTGACAPAIATGHSYFMSAWFKSSQRVWPVAYYRNTSGSWVFFAQGPVMYSSPTTWTQVRWTTPPLPADATAVSVGLSLRAVGWVTGDDYYLADADPSVPAVTLSAPADGALLRGTVSLAGTASDDDAVDHVDFLVDGQVVATDASAPYGASLDTTALGNGAHAIAARAVDAAGNAATWTNVATVDNQSPTASITAPAGGSSLRGTVALTATAGDNIAVDHVDFLVDGQAVATDASAPYATSLDTTTLGNGSHTIAARAVDTATNASTTSPSTVQVDNQAPTVSLTSPVDGAGVSGTVSLSATAGDNLALARVEFLVDGQVAATDTGAPYGASYNTTSNLTDGSHTVAARAVDGAGNATTSAVATIIVSNQQRNVLQNPSLETDANADQVPDCWQLGGSGNNAFSWARTTDAHSGGFAETSTITAYTDGDRKLVSRQDTGACAPAITVGHSYFMSAWFKSNQPIRPVAYYRNTSGSWVFFAQGPQVSASPTGWTQVRWTLPPMPADATLVSVGLSLRAVGWVTGDDYYLADAS